MSIEGAEQYDCVIVGLSHTLALGVPLGSETGAPVLMPLNDAFPRMCGLTAERPRGDPYWAAVRELAPGRTLFVLWGGNSHQAHYLVEPDEPFDILLPDRPDLDPDAGATIVPISAVEELVRVWLDGMESMLADLRNEGATVIVCGTPPPKADGDFIRSVIGKEKLFVNIAAAKQIEVGELRLSPPGFMLKLWMLIQAGMVSIAADLDLPFIPAPPEGQTEDGYLKPEYYADATHANRDYGRLLMERIEQTYAAGASA